MALLSAIAARGGCNLLDVLRPKREEFSRGPSDVPICALIDSYGSPADTAFVASALVEEGFTTIKIKVTILHHKLLYLDKSVLSALYLFFAPR